ncbi:MAG TPA: hypothetical protein VJN48_03185 [Terriglobales bacterium]|nr:hypothetical protein [Terriglobales bacterium]
MGPEREGGLAQRVCDANISWGKDRLVVAANAATVDLDVLGATLGKMGPVAAFQVRSNPNDFMSYVIYSLRKPPHVLRRLNGASTFSAADTDLDGRVEIWADDAAAVDGLDGLLASEFDFLPTSVLRFEQGRLLDVSAQFQPYYDHVIESVRAVLSAQQLEDFKTSASQPGLKGIVEAERLHRIRETKIKVLELVWAYLYSGRQEDAWQALAEMWPPQDMSRIKNAISTARSDGIESQIDGIASDAHQRKRRAGIYQVPEVTPPRAIQISVLSNNGPLHQVVPDINVTLELVIDCAGKVRSLKSSGPDWTQAYLEDAAKGWKFIPAFKAGRSVASRQETEVSLRR